MWEVAVSTFGRLATSGNGGPEGGGGRGSRGAPPPPQPSAPASRLRVDVFRCFRVDIFIMFSCRCFACIFFHYSFSQGLRGKKEEGADEEVVEKSLIRYIYIYIYTYIFRPSNHARHGLYRHVHTACRMGGKRRDDYRGASLIRNCPPP